MNHPVTPNRVLTLLIGLFSGLSTVSARMDKFIANLDVTKIPESDIGSYRLNEPEDVNAAKQIVNLLSDAWCHAATTNSTAGDTIFARIKEWNALITRYQLGILLPDALKQDAMFLLCSFENAPINNDLDNAALNNLYHAGAIYRSISGRLAILGLGEISGKSFAVNLPTNRASNWESLAGANVPDLPTTTLVFTSAANLKDLQLSQADYIQYVVGESKVYQVA